jgi:hypothetical protein
MKKMISACCVLLCLMAGFSIQAKYKAIVKGKPNQVIRGITPIVSKKVLFFL